jgi:methyl-accepting chemotaxis protein
MDIKTLTDDELEQHRVDVLTEQERRQRIANAPTQISQIATAVHEMSATAVEVASNAEQTADAARSSSSSVRKGLARL